MNEGPRGCTARWKRIARSLVGSEGEHGPLPARLLPIFRDREELASGADLPARIRVALASSRSLVVICSPRAARSRWVAEEIRSFVAIHGPQQVYCLIVDGEPNASAVLGREDQECFPAPIRFRLDAQGGLTNEPAEPIAADARPQAY